MLSFSMTPPHAQFPWTEPAKKTQAPLLVQNFVGLTFSQLYLLLYKTNHSLSPSRTISSGLQSHKILPLFPTWWWAGKLGNAEGVMIIFPDNPNSRVDFCFLTCQLQQVNFSVAGVQVFSQDATSLHFQCWADVITWKKRTFHIHVVSEVASRGEFILHDMMPFPRAVAWTTEMQYTYNVFLYGF